MASTGIEITSLNDSHAAMPSGRWRGRVWPLVYRPANSLTVGRESGIMVGCHLLHLQSTFQPNSVGFLKAGPAVTSSPIARFNAHASSFWQRREWPTK